MPSNALLWASKSCVVSAIRDPSLLYESVTLVIARVPPIAAKAPAAPSAKFLSCLVAACVLLSMF